MVERIPVVSWTEGSQKSWVDADGNKFAARTELPGLLPITVDDAAGHGLQDRAAGRGGRRAAVAAAAAQHRAAALRRQHGLSYQDGRGWRGYFGVGTDMLQKLAVYEQLVTNLTARGIQPKTISVESYQAPYYTK